MIKALMIFPTKQKLNLKVETGTRAGYKIQNPISGPDQPEPKTRPVI